MEPFDEGQHLGAAPGALVTLAGVSVPPGEFNPSRLMDLVEASYQAIAIGRLV
jgi:hypothetical protein